MGLMINPCSEVMLTNVWQECILNYWVEIEDYYIMLNMERLGNIPPAAKLIALEIMPG